MPGLIWSRMISALVVSLVLLCLSDSAEAQIQFDLRPQPLASALSTVGNLANINVLFDSTLVDGLRAPPLKAALSAEEALTQLLVGTRLRVVRVNRNTLSVVTEAEARRAEAARDPTTGATYSPTSVRLAYAGVEAASDSSNDTSVYHRSDESGAADAPGASDGGRHDFQEVIVTAQKRTERLIDTPQSVSVVSNDELEKLGATQFTDYANTVPGLGFSTQGTGYTNVSLRGVTAGPGDTSPTVGLYVDDVPYGSSITDLAVVLALDSSLFDVDRIEVLRGPQGTLYGSSSMGGLIKYVTKQPDVNGFSADVRTGVSGTQHGGISYDVAGVVNAPIVKDTLAIRASGFESHEGGYIDDIGLGQKDVDRSNTYGGRLDTLFKPSEALSIRITAFLQNISRHGTSEADYDFDGAPLYNGLSQVRKFEEPFDQRFRLISGTVNYDFGSMKLTSVSGYQTIRSQAVFDVSALYVPALQFLFDRSYNAVGLPITSSTNKFTQELRLASAGKDKIEWLIGGFYSHDSSSSGDSFELRDPADQPAVNDLLTLSKPVRFEEYAAFGDLTWHLSSHFDVTGGLRYAHDHLTFGATGTGLLGSFASLDTVESNQGVVTYLANMRYHFSDQATGYLRYATGYRNGGPNAYLSSGFVGPKTYQSDSLKSYEGGYKAETADRRFGLDLAIYYINWSNIQVADAVGIVNAPGGATIKGSELTLTARPTPEFTMTGAFAYMNSYLREADTDLGAQAGERLPNVPHFTAAANADYAFANDGLRPTIGATLRYVDARPASFENGADSGWPQYHLPPYTMADLRGGVTLGSVTLQLYVHNLLDKRSQFSAYTGYGVPYVAIAQPRTIGATATAHF